jgi:hypothetical protein
VVALRPDLDDCVPAVHAGVLDPAVHLQGVAGAGQYSVGTCARDGRGRGRRAACGACRGGGAEGEPCGEENGSQGGGPECRHRAVFLSWWGMTRAKYGPEQGGVRRFPERVKADAVGRRSAVGGQSAWIRVRKHGGTRPSILLLNVSPCRC